MNTKYSIGEKIKELLDRSEKEGKIEKISSRNDAEEWIVVDFKDLYAIFGVENAAIKDKIIKLGYYPRQRYNRWYFKRYKDNEKNIKIDDSEDLELKNLENELIILEKSVKYHSNKGDLCKLLNLRKIYNIRKGDKDSLLLDNFAEEFTSICRLSKYEEIRLGLKLLFKDDIGQDR